LQQHVFLELHEKHWHGAVPNRLMTYLTMLKVDAEGASACWGEHVTDDEYS
jgi:quercetin dioxygenase-like cupin family protein